MNWAGRVLFTAMLIIRLNSKWAQAAERKRGRRKGQKWAWHGAINRNGQHVLWCKVNRRHKDNARVLEGQRGRFSRARDFLIAFCNSFSTVFLSFSALPAAVEAAAQLAAIKRPRMCCQSVLPTLGRHAASTFDFVMPRQMPRHLLLIICRVRKCATSGKTAKRAEKHSRGQPKERGRENDREREGNNAKVFAAQNKHEN